MIDPQYDGPYRVGLSSRTASYQTGLPSDEEDPVDAIPIVKLDLDLRSPSPQAPRQLSPPPPREPTPPPMFVDVDGELPPGLNAAPPVVAPRAAATPSPKIDSPAEVTAPAVEVVATEGTAVKVVKKKKKKTGAEGKSKKSRPAVKDAGAE